jgi:hypothetical protein
LGARSQGQQGGDGAGPDQEGDGHVGGVVGTDGNPAQRDQEGGANSGKTQAAGQEQATGGGGGGDGGVVREEGAVPGPAADGMHHGERPVGAGSEVEVAGELVELQGGGPAQAGQDDHGHVGRVAAAQYLDGQDGQQQRRCGGQDGGGHQDQQAQRLGLGGVVQRWTSARSTTTSSAMGATGGG